MDISCYTEIGGRKVNEDALAVVSSETSALLILADGVGSCDNGRLASDTLVVTVRRELEGRFPEEDALADAVVLAGEELRRYEGSVCTTAAVVWMQGTSAVVGNVGDSRIYQFRNRKIIYQSIDHSVAQLAVLAGELSRDKIRQSPDKNRLIRAVGGRPGKLRVDTEELVCCPGDAFLLCTDGFWNEITEKEMLEDACASENESAAAWLARMRRRIDSGNRSLDNHSAIVMKL